MDQNFSQMEAVTKEKIRQLRRNHVRFMRRCFLIQIALLVFVCTITLISVRPGLLELIPLASSALVSFLAGDAFRRWRNAKNRMDMM